MKRITLSEYQTLFSDPSPSVGDGAVLFLPGREDFPLPRRKAVSHKYSYGRALIVSGSRGFSGAAALAANACERSGAGLTHLVVPDSIYPIAASRCDGVVVTPLPSAENGAFSPDALQSVLTLLRRADACVIGPGIGTGEASRMLVDAVLREADCPVVLDADALTICGRNTALLRSAHVSVILTPHEGEFRRLSGDLSHGRLAGALDFTARFEDLLLVLKGHGTLICRGKEVCVNPVGSPAMAKGGSGDVLCGVLCALLAQGFDPLFSARCAVYLHGLAGEFACEELGEYSVTPSDLIRFLPAAFRSLGH